MLRQKQLTSIAFPSIVCFMCFLFKLTINTKVLRSGEYCDTEVFRAECPEGDVILLNRALYGRMRIGRCVEFDVAGYVGCMTDVLQMADRRCSGRRVCEIRIPDAEFEGTGPCLKELKTYLEAAYSCVTVESVTSDICKSHRELNVTRSRGYLVSGMTSEVPSCDATSHPWVIKGQPGQRIRLTLYDFAMVDLEGQGQRGAYNNSWENRTGVAPEPPVSLCKDYGIIYDNGRHRMSFLCGQNRRRVDNAFESIGHVVKIWMTSSLNSDGVYLVHYEVFGCSDPEEIPAHAQFVRMNGDYGYIQCLYSEVTWPLNCSDDDNWRRPLANCTPPEAQVAEEVSSSKIHLSIVAGCGFVTILLLIVFLFLLHILRKSGRNDSRGLIEEDVKKPNAPQPTSSSPVPLSHLHHPLAKSSSQSSSSSKSPPPPPQLPPSQSHLVTVNGCQYEHLWNKCNHRAFESTKPQNINGTK